MSEKTNRNRTISFRLTDEEYAISQKIIEKCGVPQSEHFRKFAVNGPNQPHQNVGNLRSSRQTLALLHVACSNIEEIAHRLGVEASNGSPNDEQIYAILSQLVRLNSFLDSRAKNDN